MTSMGGTTGLWLKTTITAIRTEKTTEVLAVAVARASEAAAAAAVAVAEAARAMAAEGRTANGTLTVLKTKASP